MKPTDSHDLPPEGGSHEFTLTAGLRAVAEDDEQLGASSGVGMRLLAEVQGIAAARRRRLAVLSLSAAAAVLTAVLVPGWRMFQQTTTNPPQAVDAPAVTRELVTEFFPLTYSNVPARGGYVVRMQVPRAALTSFGATLTAAGDNASPNVLADVVIGNDGLARAVRFVQVMSDRSPAEAGHHVQEQTP